MQELPTLIGTTPPTAALSGRPLTFPQLSYLETHPSHPAVVAVARQLAMTSLQSTWYGHCTPGRPFSHICTLQHPSHLPEKCPFSHCMVEGCLGNHLQCSADGGTYTLHVPHSKTSASMVGPISYNIPPSLFPWLDSWLRFGWPIVAKEVSGWSCMGLQGLQGLSGGCAAAGGVRALPPSVLKGTSAAPPSLLAAGNHHCLLHPCHWCPHHPQQAHLPLQGGCCQASSVVLYCMWYCMLYLLQRVRYVPGSTAGSDQVCPHCFLCAGVAHPAAQAVQAHLCA